MRLDVDDDDNSNDEHVHEHVRARLHMPVCMRVCMLTRVRVRHWCLRVRERLRGRICVRWCILSLGQELEIHRRRMRVSGSDQKAALERRDSC